MTLTLVIFLTLRLDIGDRSPAIMCDENLERLIGLLKDGAVKNRLAAVEKLGELGPRAEKATPALIDLLLTEKNEEVTGSIGYALSQIGRRAVPYLEKRICPKKADECVRLLQALLNLQGESIGALHTVAKLLEEDNVSIRCHAVRVLAKMKSEEGVKHIVKAYAKDSDDSVQWEACRAFANLGKLAAPAVPLLIERIGKNLSEANFALGCIGRPAIPLLIQFIADPKRLPIDRAAAVWSFTVMSHIYGPKEPTESIPVLIRLLGDNNQEIVEASVEALGEMGRESRSAIPFLEQKARGKCSPGLSVLLGIALFSIDPENRYIVPMLRNALNSANSGVRSRAADFLFMAGPKAKTINAALTEPLIGLFADKDYTVRRQAVDALSSVGLSKAARAAVIKLKTDQSEAVREAAARALGQKERP